MPLRRRMRRILKCGYEKAARIVFTRTMHFTRKNLLTNEGVKEIIKEFSRKECAEKGGG